MVVLQPSIFDVGMGVLLSLTYGGLLGAVGFVILTRHVDRFLDPTEYPAWVRSHTPTARVISVGIDIVLLGSTLAVLVANISSTVVGPASSIPATAAFLVGIESWFWSARTGAKDTDYLARHRPSAFEGVTDPETGEEITRPYSTDRYESRSSYTAMRGRREALSVARKRWKAATERGNHHYRYLHPRTDEPLCVACIDVGKPPDEVRRGLIVNKPPRDAPVDFSKPTTIRCIEHARAEIDGADDSRPATSSDTLAVSGE